MSFTFTSELQETLDVQVHRLAANLMFDDHGLSPYHGMVSAFDPDHDQYLDNFGALNSDFSVENSVFWNGKLADPDGQIDDGLYEFKYGLWEHDDVGDRGADLTFRPGYPEATHVETGDLIGGIPNSCPESLRVQVEATNLTKIEVLRLMRAFGQHIGLNSDYFRDAHEWSSIYGLETYVRPHRDSALGNIVGKGGVLEHIAEFSNGRGKGVHKWDHEEIIGKYEAVSLDPDSWERLIPDQTLAKRLKCYQPYHVRSEESDDDPLYHPKLECQYWKGYYPDGDDSLDWSGYDYAVEELKQTTLNALNWAEFPLHPDDDVYVADAYFDVEESDEEVEIVSNPMPDLKEQEQQTAKESLMDPDATTSEWEVLAAMTDGGPRNYQELAEESGTSSSSVYRAGEQFDDIIEIIDGEVRFLDEVVHETISGIVERLEAAKDNAFESIHRVAQRASPLSRSDGEPSALEKWANRHGITARKTHDNLEFELERAVSEREIQKIVRAGLEAAEASGILTTRFRNALLTWKGLDGEVRKGWQMYVNGRILGQVSENSALW